MRVTVDMKGFEDIVDPGKLAGQQARIYTVVAKTGADVEAGAKARSRVDSGTMRANWTHSIKQGGDMILTDVTNPVDYTIHNEFGTWKMSAQPMAIPALDQATPGFIAAAEQALGDV